MFIPVAPEELDAIRGARELTNRRAHAAIPALREALEYDEGDDEDLEHAAMVIASVAALAEHGARTVLVAEVPAQLVSEGEDPGNGQVLVERVPQTAITCWFADADGVDIADAAAAAHGLDIDTAWDFPQVQELLAEHDLLWNDVQEFTG